MSMPTVTDADFSCPSCGSSDLRSFGRDSEYRCHRCHQVVREVPAI